MTTKQTDKQKLIVNIALEKLRNQNTSIDQVNLKVGQLIGFLGVIITLVAANRLSNGFWTFSLILLILSLCVFLQVFRLKKYSFLPKFEDLITQYNKKQDNVKTLLKLFKTNFGDNNRGIEETKILIDQALLFLAGGVVAYVIGVWT